MYLWWLINHNIKFFLTTQQRFTLKINVDYEDETHINCIKMLKWVVGSLSFTIWCGWL